MKYIATKNVKTAKPLLFTWRGKFWETRAFGGVVVRYKNVKEIREHAARYGFIVTRIPAPKMGK